MIKFWHLRAVDPEICADHGEDIILPFGGLTVAYTCTMTDIMVNVAKCREFPCIVPEKLARRDAAYDAILLDFKNSPRHDAAKLCEVRQKLARVMRMPIHTYDLFCYKKGREEAARHLKDYGPLEILELEHPISSTIADWVANTLWPLGPKVLDYRGHDMGFAIDIWRDERGRWVSDFQESEGVVVNDFPFQRETEDGLGTD